MSTPTPTPRDRTDGLAAREDLSAWLDGELSPEEAAELEAELERDPALRADLESLETVVRFVREEAPTVAPPGFHQRILAHVEASEQPSGLAAWLGSWLGGLRWEAVLLAGAAAAVLVFVVPAALPERGASETSPGAVKLPPRDGLPAEQEPEAVRAQPRDRDVASAPTSSTPTSSTPDGTPQVIGRASVADDAERVAKSVEVPVTGPTNLVWEDGHAPTAEVVPAPTPAPAPPGEVELGAQEFGYGLSSADPAMKRKVLAFAGRFGRVTDSEGAEIGSAVLEGREELVVHVPPAELAAFAKGLEALGFPMTASRPDELLPNGDVAVHLLLDGSAAR